MLVSALIRSSLDLIWFLVSSPETYKTFSPLRDMFEAMRESILDLPTPGAPANSTIPPGTKPPPNTLSTSPTPYDKRSYLEAFISLMSSGLSPDDTLSARLPTLVVDAARRLTFSASTMVSIS